METNHILQWDFHDTFFNLTLKQVLFLQWQEVRCANTSFVLNRDDDVFAHTDNMVSYLQGHDPGRHLFVGQLIRNMGPIWVFCTPTENKQRPFFSGLGIARSQPLSLAFR